MPRPECVVSGCNHYADVEVYFYDNKEQPMCADHVVEVSVELVKMFVPIHGLVNINVEVPSWASSTV